MPSETLRDAISDELVAHMKMIPSPEWLDSTVNAIATAVELAKDPIDDGWNPECCRREREACAQLAQDAEERGWGRKGYHPVADAIRGRGAWCQQLSDEARAARAALPSSPGVP